MAIIRTKETSKTILDEQEFVKSPIEEKVIITKKRGFLRSTIAELRLVNWPTLKHTLNWSGTVIAFTLIMIVFVGGVDKIFKGGFDYATCTASYKKGNGGSNYEQCGKQFGQSLITFN